MLWVNGKRQSNFALTRNHPMLYDNWIFGIMVEKLNKVGII